MENIDMVICTKSGNFKSCDKCKHGKLHNRLKVNDIFCTVWDTCGGDDGIQEEKCRCQKIKD